MFSLCYSLFCFFNCYSQDIEGSNEANLNLYRVRAKSVVEAIVKGGIDNSRLSFVGYGEEKPIADNTMEAGKAQNRRVELIRNNKNTFPDRW